MRRSVGGSRRKPWEELFLDGGFDVGLTREAAGAYEVPLEMARLAPSASNRQPVRIVRDGKLVALLHPPNTGLSAAGLRARSCGLEDLQRVDSGIADVPLRADRP